MRKNMQQCENICKNTTKLCKNAKKYSKNCVQTQQVSTAE